MPADATEAVELRRLVVRWAILFAVLLGFLFFVLWWAGAALHFSAARVRGLGKATLAVTGRVIDAHTGKSVPWAEIIDDPEGRPPLFASRADQNGGFRHLTLPEPHTILINALGYRTGSVQVGRQWFVWTPKATQTLEISLVPEPAPAIP
ncbi:MAG: hypothetical protein HYS04_06965 [Acidobacteria bacterium]|nr:hypothetical protein [Acidobacteriota bacterium]